MSTRGIRVGVSLALAIACAGFVRRAEACSPVPPRWPSFAEPIFENESIRIETERVDLDCHPSGRDARCSLTVALRLKNARASPVATRGIVLTSPFVAGLSVSDPEREATPTNVQPFRERLPQHGFEREFLRRAFAFPLELGPGETRDVTLRASFTIQRFVDPCSSEGIQARHPIFWAGTRRGDFELRYFHQGIQPGRTRIDVHTRSPREWDLLVHVAPAAEIQGRALPPTAALQRWETEASTSVETARSSALIVGLTVPRSTFWGGGPFVGAGYAFGIETEGGLRLRLGYEFAAPVWLVHSVAVESDAQRLFAVIPGTEVVSGSQRMFPLVLGAGAGVPVRIAPELRAGGRVGASVGFSELMLRGGVDVYPETAASKTSVEGWIGGQLTL